MPMHLQTILEMHEDLGRKWVSKYASRITQEALQDQCALTTAYPLPFLALFPSSTCGSS